MIYYGYACYGYGCLTEPPGVQLPDPNPLPDIEANYVPPTTYSSTQPYTALCPAGTYQRTIGGSLSVAGENAPFVESSTSTSFTIFTAVAFNVTASESANGNATMKLDGSSDGLSWVELATSAPQIFLADTVVQTLIPVQTSYAFYRATLTPAGLTVSCPGTYTVDVLLATGPGVGITKTATATSQISQLDALQKAYNQAKEEALTELAAVGCATVYTSTQTVTSICDFGLYGQPITQTATRTSLISQADADALATAAATQAANALKDCTQSNNTSAIQIVDSTGDPEPAVPYPSVSFQSGLTGAITRIRVNLLNYIHENCEDVEMLLISPLGKAVLLMLNCGGANPIPTPINLVFDSNSVNPLPDATVITAGTYQPTQYGSQSPFAAPVPANPYLTDFSTLIGDSPNGAWSLWICDKTTLDTGAVQNGWTLTLDTA